MARTFALLCFCVWALASCSSGNNYDNFKWAIHHANDERNAADAGHVFHPYDITVQLDKELVELKSSLDLGNYRDAEIEIRDLTNQFSDVRFVTNATNSLLDEVHAHEKTEVAVLDANFPEVQKEIPDALLRAEKPEDLDPLLKKLDDLDAEVRRDWTYEGSQGLTRYEEFANGFSNIQFYIKYWQSYFKGLQEKNTRDLFYRYNYLTHISFPNGFPRMDRAQIEARLQLLNTNAGLPATPVYVRPEVPPKK